GITGEVKNRGVSASFTPWVLEWDSYTQQAKNSLIKPLRQALFLQFFYSVKQLLKLSQTHELFVILIMPKPE
ncbi:hypothetical protein, partial [Vibrio parahaemolyticus]